MSENKAFFIGSKLRHGWYHC